MMEIAKRFQTIDDTKFHQKLWEIYTKSFAETKTQCAQIQMCYTKKKFVAALLDHDYWKFVLFLNDKPIGIALLTNNLKKAEVAYISKASLRAQYPRYTQEGRLYYVSAIGVLPQEQRKGNGLQLLAEIIDFINENASMVGYDFSSNKNSSLPALIIHAAKTINNISIVRKDLDTQVFTTLHGPHHGKPG